MSNLIEHIMGGLILLVLFFVIAVMITSQAGEDFEQQLHYVEKQSLKNTYLHNMGSILQLTEKTSKRSVGELLADAIYYRNQTIKIGENASIDVEEVLREVMDASFGPGRYFITIEPVIVDVSLNFVIDGSDSLADERSTLAAELPGIIFGVKQKIKKGDEEPTVRVNIHILGDPGPDRFKCEPFRGRSEVVCQIITSYDIYLTDAQSSGLNVTRNETDTSYYKVEYNITPPYENLNELRTFRTNGEKDYYEADWGSGVAYASAYAKGQARLALIFPMSDELSTSSIPETCFTISDQPSQKVCDICGNSCPTNRSMRTVDIGINVARDNKHIVNPIFAYNCDYEYREIFNTYWQLVKGSSTSNACSMPGCNGCSIDPASGGVCFHPTCKDDITSQMQKMADETGGRMIELAKLSDLIMSVENAIEENVQPFSLEIGKERQDDRYADLRVLPLPDARTTEMKVYIYPEPEAGVVGEL